MGGKVRHISRIWPPGDVTDLFDTRLTVKLSPSLALAEMGIKKSQRSASTPPRRTHIVLREKWCIQCQDNERELFFFPQQQNVPNPFQILLINVQNPLSQV